MKVTITLSTGQKLEKIISADEATVGRSTKADIVIPDEALSRLHCRIEIKAGSFFITDLGSSNGVFTDGDEIEPNTRKSFNSFNQLALGPLDCIVEDTDKAEVSEGVVRKSNEPRAVKSAADMTGKTVMMKTPPKKKPANQVPPAAVAGAVVIAIALAYYFLA